MQDSVLLVGSSDKSRALLQALLPPELFDGATLCQCGDEARRFSAQTAYTLVVINTPLSDENGLDLALLLARQSSASVILLVKSDLADAVAARMEPRGVMVLAKPVAKTLFEQALRFARVMNGRLDTLKQANEELEQKLADVRLVDRAKCVLIQYLRMTEDQAHRHIEKQAMDTRQTKAAIARSILATYEM